MNLPIFISNRIARGSAGSFSTTINRMAVISIGLGLAVLILSFMVLYGFKSEIRSKIYSFSGHLIVNKYTLSSSFEETSIEMTDELLKVINDYPLTDRVRPFALKAGLLKTDEEVQGVIIKGVDESFGSLGFSQHIIEGKFPDITKGTYSTEVAVSSKIANYLKLKTGDEVLIYFVQNPPRFRRLQVAGVYETWLEEFDEQMIIGDLDLIRRINGWEPNVVGGLEVFISDADRLADAENDLFNRVGIDLYVDKVTDKFIETFDWLNLLNRNVAVLLIIILFVSGTSIISIMLILIMERTQMIGVLKALGASDRFIQRIFVINGLRLVTNGLVWGNLIGISLGLLQYYFEIIPLDTASYYMDHVPIEFDIVTIILLNLLILIIISLTLMLPVAIVSRIKPVKAIRFD